MLITDRRQGAHRLDRPYKCELYAQARLKMAVRRAQGGRALLWVAEISLAGQASASLHTS